MPDHNPRRGAPLIWIAVPALAALALAGCGSGVQTVSVKSPPPRAEAQAKRAGSPSGNTGGPRQTTTKATTPPPPQPEKSPQAQEQSQAQGNGATGGNAGNGARTAPEPEFTEEEKKEPVPQGGPLSLQEAEQLLGGQGYEATDTSGYRTEGALSVLIGKSTSGAGEQAFFFSEGRYLGTDTSAPSAAVTLASHTGTEVTLEYALYGKGEEPAGSAQVRYRLQGGRLVPLDPIPPVSSRR